ncbi:TonB-dependent receptor plug domain-containing protein [Microbulbifer hydrolyticus]|uniref:TonB-dependent receptor n=1 Tax=Microbulbifer hydrolyticus TaxID=48074 RepID=A0A6P1TF39_9GAMM|nr:TonB-dependent receptor [Microbulbifer hydrolyticus]MBB5212687.1 vitamin B12 transporter [Microbulbifer hydrolyticus]QHQ40283.1 TonB-dependent receptor [Microbulbifer hydrolyticus]
MRSYFFSSLAGAIALAAQPVLADETQLEQVTITASRVEIPRAESGVSVSVLTAVDIQQLGYSTLLDVIKTLPGISISNTGGLGKVSNVYVRGEASSRTLVLLDGVNMADAANTQVTTQFQHILAGDVERIEVLRGPQGMMYGAGAGGVINIITKRGNKPLQLELSAEGGRYDTERTQIAARGQQGGWDYKLDLNQLDSDGFNARESDTSGERDGYENQTGSASLGYSFSENFSIDGRVWRTEADTGFDNCYLGWDIVNDCLDSYQQTSYQLGANLTAAGVNHRLSLSNQELERASYSAGTHSFSMEGSIAELNYIGTRALAGGSITWGADMDQQEYASAGSMQDVDILGIYSEWRSDIADNVFYSVGYRHDRLEDRDHNSWRISAAVPQLIGDNQQLKYRASASTGFRAPSPYEISTNLSGGVDPVGPETSRGYELGVEYRYADLLQLELVAFQQSVTDAIVYVSGIGTGWGAYVQDDGESDSDGIELSLAGSLGESGRWYANGTWLDSTDSEGEQRLNVAERVYNLGASYTLLANTLTLSGNWRHAADRASPALVFGGPAERLDSYNRFDLNAVYDFSERVSFNLRGENLLDEDYREVAGFYTTGAAVYAGVKFNLN